MVGCRKRRGLRGVKEGLRQRVCRYLIKQTPPEEVATLKREITKDVLDKVVAFLQKMGGPHVDLENIIIEDQQSQHGDPKISVERTPEPITLVAQNQATQPITPEAQNPTLETMNSVTQNPKPTPQPFGKGT